MMKQDIMMKHRLNSYWILYREGSRKDGNGRYGDGIFAQIWTSFSLLWLFPSIVLYYLLTNYMQCPDPPDLEDQYVIWNQNQLISILYTYHLHLSTYRYLDVCVSGIQRTKWPWGLFRVCNPAGSPFFLSVPICAENVIHEVAIKTEIIAVFMKYQRRGKSGDKRKSEQKGKKKRKCLGGWGRGRRCARKNLRVPGQSRLLSSGTTQAVHDDAGAARRGPQARDHGSGRGHSA